jgi:hypothetical protein
VKRGLELVQREKRLVGLYVAKRFPNAHVFINKQLGPVVTPPGWDDLPANVRKTAHAFRRKADAIVITPTLVVIVEAKIKIDGSEIGQLLIYRQLFASTPEFSADRDKPVKMIAVTWVPDAVASYVAQRVGITVEVFQPAEMKDMIESGIAQRARIFQQGFAGLSENLKQTGTA